MALENVSERYDGETPDADALNELLAALIPILNAGGLPASAIGWPLVAQGPLDMNGNSILNAGELFGLIHVNSGYTLAEAVAVVNASNAGGTIVIDPGYQATTTTAGLTITADDVSIYGYGGKSELYMPDRVAGGAGLYVTGSRFTLQGLNISSEVSPSNLTSMIELYKASDANITGNVFTSVNATGIMLSGDTSSETKNSMVANNRFTSGAAKYIDIYSASDSVIQGNTMSGNSSININIEGGTSLYCRRNSIVANNISGGTHGIYNSSTGFVSRKDYCTITGNTIACASGVAIDLGGLAYSNVNNNFLTGDTVVRQFYGTFNGNELNDICTFSGATRLNAQGNFFASDAIIGTGNTYVSMQGNFFTTALEVPATTGVINFSNNYGYDTIEDLEASDVLVYFGNNARNGVT